MIAKICSFLAFGMLLMFFVGCAPVYVLPTAIPTQSPTSTSAFVPTTTPFSTPTLLPATSQPLNFYFPEVEKRCPENREVSFGELGIESGLKVILSDINQTGLWRFSIENQVPILIKALPLDTWTGSSLNPTGENLAFIVRNQDNSSSIWLLSLISGDQSEIFSINYMEGAYPYIRWLSNDELLVGGSCAGAGCPFPIKVLNVTRGVEIDVEETDSGPYDNYLGFFANNGEYLALYSSYADDGYTQIHVYDYSASQKVWVFPWLEDKIFFYPLIGTNFGLFGSDNNVAMFVEQSYGFDVGVVDANVEKMTQALSYDSVMKRVVTDVQFGELDYSFIDLNPSNRGLIVNMSYTDYFNSTVNDDFTTEPKYVEDALFVVDLEHPVVDERISDLTFIDYCFMTTGYFNRGFSPDGRIEVFSSDNEIVFLNLETGNFSRMSGWLFVGWSKR